MSYILDALRKAERDRQTTPVPTIDAVHAPPLGERTLRLWPWLVAGALAVNAVVLVAVFRPRHVEVPVPAGPTTAQAVLPAAPADGVARSVREPATAPATAPPRAGAGDGAAVTTAPRAAEAEVPLPAPSRRGERPVAAAVPKTPEPPREAEPAPRTETPKVAAVPAPASQPGEAVASPETPRDRLDMTPTKRPEGVAPAAPARRTEAAAPALQDLPASFRESAPKLRLEVLLYSDAPAERMVFINGRKYREGDTIEGNTVVETIVRDGAVLSYQGQRYLLRE